MKQNTDYGFDIQKTYLEMMLSDAQTFVRCQGIFNPESFDRKLQDVATFLKEFVAEHNTLPTEQIINSACPGSNLKIPEGLNEQHYDWLLKEAVQIGLQKDLGIDYFEDPKARLLGLKDNNGQVSTGWESLDKKLFGGLNKGELNIFAGGSGAGKSLFLANLGVNWAQAGMNVIYLTLELSESLVAMRVDSMMTGVASREIFKDLDSVEMKVKMQGKKSGRLQIKYMPSGKTPNDVRSYIKEYEVKTGEKVDVLLIDYLDLLMPNGAKISAENLYVKDKYVSEELRNLALI